MAMAPLSLTTLLQSHEHLGFPMAILHPSPSHCGALTHQQVFRSHLSSQKLSLAPFSPPRGRPIYLTPSNVPALALAFLTQQALS